MYVRRTPRQVLDNIIVLFYLVAFNGGLNLNDLDLRLLSVFIYIKI